tara:strand:- start:828 stop:1400 length:573 start_codon:yes stop_codon:yes gene_type:complete
MSNFYNLKQCIFSPTAIKNNILNLPGSDFIPNNEPTLSQDNIILNLHRLFKYCINPLIEKFGDDLVLISTYRTKELNKLMGGVENSQHVYGYAADIALNNNTASSYLFNWCKTYIPQYHQLIWEYPERGIYSSYSPNFSWVHISYIKENNVKVNSVSSSNPKVHKAYRDENTFFLNKFTHKIELANQAII